jgi:hypothetical protein
VQVHDFRLPEEYFVAVKWLPGTTPCSRQIALFQKAVPMVAAAAESVSNELAQSDKGVRRQQLWVRLVLYGACLGVHHRCLLLQGHCMRSSIQGGMWMSSLWIGRFLGFVHRSASLSLSLLSICLARTTFGIGLQVKKVVVLSPHGIVSFDWDNTDRAKVCVWRKARHIHNYTYATVDFLRGSFSLKCWDEDCKKRHGRDWMVHPFSLPDALCGHADLFTEPLMLDDQALEDMLVFVDGSRIVTE